MKEYTIPVSWQMISDIKIKANSLSEAIQQAKEINSEESIPKGHYVNHSFEIQEDFLEETE
jgi:hypothetical protein